MDWVTLVVWTRTLEPTKCSIPRRGAGAGAIKSVGPDTLWKTKCGAVHAGFVIRFCTSLLIYFFLFVVIVFVFKDPAIYHWKKKGKPLYRCKVCYYFDQTMTRFILFIISTAAISGFTGFTEIYVYYINFTIFVKIAKIIQRFMHTNKSN